MTQLEMEIESAQKAALRYLREYKLPEKLKYLHVEIPAIEQIPEHLKSCVEDTRVILNVQNAPFRRMLIDFRVFFVFKHPYPVDNSKVRGPYQVWFTTPEKVRITTVAKSGDRALMDKVIEPRSLMQYQKIKNGFGDRYVGMDELREAEISAGFLVKDPLATTVNFDDYVTRIQVRLA